MLTKASSPIAIQYVWTRLNFLGTVYGMYTEIQLMLCITMCYHELEAAPQVQ